MTKPSSRGRLALVPMVVIMLLALAVGPSEASWQVADGPGTILDRGAMQDGAVLPRSAGAAFGTTIVRGIAPGATLVRAWSEAGGAEQLVTEAVVAGGGEFEVELRVPAVAQQHTAHVSVLINDAWVLLASVSDVVGGDVYLIQGQSNSVAAIYGGGSGLQHLASPWIRSFGSAARSADPDAYQWNQAQAAVAYADGSIGQWGMQLGADMFAATGVPVAVINGGDGGKPASFFQRNDADRFDLATNYGRFLDRLRAAGIDEGAAVIGWYQGESDANQPAVHTEMVHQLFDDWHDDMPALHVIHLVQIHDGCGAQSDLPVQAAQYRIGLERAEVQLVSTVALPGHDGCHYRPEGYAQLGSQIAQLTLRDIVGVAAADGIDSPVAVSAAYTNGDRTRVRIHFERGDEQLTPNGLSDFVVDDPGANVETIATGTGWIDLQLAQAPQAASMVSYLGSSEPWPTTPWGAAPVIFDALPIEAVTSSTPNCDGSLEITDALFIAQFSVGNRTDSGGCPLDGNAIHAAAGDLDGDGQTDVIDALRVAQCAVGIEAVFCP